MVTVLTSSINIFGTTSTEVFVEGWLAPSPSCVCSPHPSWWSSLCLFCLFCMDARAEWDHGYESALKWQGVWWKCDKPRNGLCKPEAERSERGGIREQSLSLETVFLNSFPAVVSSSEESVVRGSNFQRQLAVLVRERAISGQLSVWVCVHSPPGARKQVDWLGLDLPTLWPQTIGHSFLKAQVPHLTNGRIKSPCLGCCKIQLDDMVRMFWKIGSVCGRQDGLFPSWD